MSNKLHHMPLPGWIESLLTNRPAAGSGIHPWLFECARGLIAWRTPQETFRILRAEADKCSRHVPDREILDCLKNARNNWQPQSSAARAIALMQIEKQAPRQKAWPEIDWPAVASIAKTGDSIATLLSASPAPVTLAAEEILTELWHGDPLLCLAKSHPADAITRRRSEWMATPGGVAQNGLIVPTPMVARTGQRQDGKASVRCLDNTGPRWHLVVEFDFKAEHNDTASPAASILAAMAAEEPPRAAPDLCAAILLHLLDKGAPLLLAVHSGGKSVHGWFPTHGATDESLKPFFASACRLGADPATWTRCQLVRLPGGTRADGARQQIIYRNPALINAA